MSASGRALRDKYTRLLEVVCLKKMIFGWSPTVGYYSSDVSEAFLSAAPSRLSWLAQDWWLIDHLCLLDVVSANWLFLLPFARIVQDARALSLSAVSLICLICRWGGHKGSTRVILPAVAVNEKWVSYLELLFPWWVYPPWIRSICCARLTLFRGCLFGLVLWINSNAKFGVHRWPLKCESALDRPAICRKRRKNDIANSL